MAWAEEEPHSSFLASLLIFCQFSLTLPVLIPEHCELILLSLKTPPVRSCHHDFDQALYRQQQQNNFPSSTFCSLSLTHRARASCWAARNVLILSLDISLLFSSRSHLDGVAADRRLSKFQFLLLSWNNFKENCMKCQCHTKLL